MPEEKKYEDLKAEPTPPDFSEEEDKKEEDANVEEKEEEKETEEEKEEEKGKEKEEEKKEEPPAWVADLTGSIKSVSERLDKIEAGAKAPTAPATDEFTPDFEKGKFFPDGYKPTSYDAHAKKLLEIVDAKKKHDVEVQTQQEKAWNNEWDRQLGQLESEGKLPKVVNASDPKDPGLVARKQLLIDAATAGSTNLISFHNVTSKYRQKPKKTPPSAGAPVGGGSGGGESGKTKREYKDLKKDIEAVKAETYPELVT